MTAEAVASLRRALELVTGPPFDEVQRGSIHYNLALALRKAGRGRGGGRPFRRGGARLRRASRRARASGLSRYLTDDLEPRADGRRRTRSWTCRSRALGPG